MGIFDFLKAKNTPTTATATPTQNVFKTVLNGGQAKKRQQLLKDIQTSKPALKTYIDIKNNAISFSVGLGMEKIIGTIDSKISRKIESQYGNGNGVSCKLIVTDYNVFEKDDQLLCEVTIKVEPTPHHK